MKTTIKKFLALVLAVLMLLSVSAAGITAFAANSSVGTVSVGAKFFRYDAALGDWVETDRAKKGETVKTRVYVNTDYFTNSGQFLVFYEDEFFTDSYERSKIIETASSPYYQELCGMTAQLAFHDKNSGAIDRFISNGVFDEEFSQTHTCVGIIYSFSFTSTNQKLSGDEWLVEFELTVKEDTALTEGSVFTMPSAFQSPDREHSFSDIPYGEEGKGYYENDSLYAVYVDIEATTNYVSTLGNIILDANGGYFDGYEQEYCIAQELGTEFRLTEASVPEKDGFNLAGWTYENGDDATVDIIPVGYEDIKLYAQWEEDIHFYTLILNANGGIFGNGSVEYTELYEAGTRVVLTEVLSKDGYLFAGWLDENGNPVDLLTMPENDVVLTASWIPATTFNVTYYLDEDGTEIYLEETYFEGESLVYPEPPSISGYTFESWSEIEGIEITEDLEIYPSYVADEYYVTVYGIYGDVVDEWIAYYGDEITLDYLLTKEDMDSMLESNGDYYTFDFWSCNGVAIDESTVITVTEDVEIEGVFTAMDAVLKFAASGGTFADGSDIFEVMLKYDEEITEDMYPAIPTREGYEFAAWSLDLTGLPMDELKKTITATWVKKSYKVNYVVDGNVIAAVNCEYGTVIDSTVIPNAAEIPAGYTFIGWSLDENADVPGELGTMGTESINVYAVLEPQQGITYTVEIYKENLDHEYVLEDTVVYADGITDEPAPYVVDDTVEGFTFNHEMSVVDFTVAGDGSTVLIVYYNRNNYEIILYVNGEAMSAETYRYGEYIEFIYPPVTPGYTFEKWINRYTGEEVIFPITMPAENLELEAMWTINEHTVTYETHTDDYIPVSVYAYGEAVELPDLSRTGYCFDGWYLDGERVYNPFIMPDCDVTLSAKWIPETDTLYTVKYYYGSVDGFGYEVVTKEFTGTSDEDITIMPESVEGFTFDVHASLFRGTIAPDGSSVFEIVYERNEYKFITYVGGAVFTDYSYLYDSTVAGTDTPSKIGHTFEKWVYKATGEDVVFPVVMPAENVEIEAVWVVNNYTVSFNVDGGTEVSSSTHKFGEDYTLPATSKTGYTFSGWRDSDGNMYAAGEVIKIPSSDVEFTAVWVVIQRYSVTYVIGGETVSFDAVAGEETPVPDMSGNPNVKLLYWLDENGEKVSIPDIMPEADLTFTAKLRYTCGGNPYGVTAEYESGCFGYEGDELRFVVENITLSREPGGVYFSGENYKQIALYNIKFYCGNAVVQPERGNKVQISIPVPASYKNSKSFLIIHRFSGGGYEQIPVSQTDNMLIFTVSRFSEFEVCVKSETSIQALPEKVNYIYKEALNLSGLALEIIDENGNKTVVDDTSAMTVNGYNPKKIGTQTLTVEFDGTSAQFDVTVRYAWWQWIIRIFLLGFLWY